MFKGVSKNRWKYKDRYRSNFEMRRLSNLNKLAALGETIGRIRATRARLKRCNFGGGGGGRKRSHN